MYKQKPNIRWTQQDHDELVRLGRQHNARLYHQRKITDNADYLPDTVKVDELKAQIKTRADFEFMKSQLRFYTEEEDAFEKVETESGIVTTKAELKQVSNANRRDNIKRAYMRKKLDVVREQTKRRLNQDEVKQYNKRNLDLDRLSKNQYGDMKERVFDMAMDKYADIRAERYKQNYIDALKGNFAAQGSDGKYYIDKDLGSIIKKIESMDGMDLYVEGLTDERKHLSFTYTADAEVEGDVMGYMKEVWEVE